MLRWVRDLNAKVKDLLLSQVFDEVGDWEVGIAW